MVLEWNMSVGLYISILSVPDGGYFRNASCALNDITTFYLQQKEHDIKIGSDIVSK